MECVIKRGITADAVPIPMGLRQVVVLQTRQVLSLFLYNMLRMSFGCCSSHLETNNCTFVVVRRAETGFLNGIVRGTCGYVRYGQVQQILCRLCCISMEKL